MTDKELDELFDWIHYRCLVYGICGSILCLGVIGILVTWGFILYG